MISLTSGRIMVSSFPTGINIVREIVIHDTYSRYSVQILLITSSRTVSTPRYFTRLLFAGGYLRGFTNFLYCLRRFRAPFRHPFGYLYFRNFLKIEKKEKNVYSISITISYIVSLNRADLNLLFERSNVESFPISQKNKFLKLSCRR